MSGCLSWRGNTRCDGARCFCNGGTCAGVDQACHDTSHSNVPYTKITSGNEQYYEIQNSRWPNYFLYVMATGAVSSSTDHDGETSDFIIMKPPQTSDQRSSTYLVYSREWPDSPLYVVQQNNNKNNQAHTPVCNRVTGGMFGLGNDPPITQLTLTFTKAPVAPLPEMVKKNQSLVMLSSPEYPNFYIYLSSMGWSAKVYENDPGAGGYWYIKTLTSKPLPKEILDAMPLYTGIRCSSFCGTAKAKAHSTNSLNFALFAFLSVVFTMFSNAI